MLCKVWVFYSEIIVLYIFFRRLKSSINALLVHGNKIPQKRVEELRIEVGSYFPPGTELTEDFLKSYAEIEIV